MVTKLIKNLRPAPNEDFLNAIRAEQSMSYQERVPEADQGNVKDILENMRTNRPLWNEFMDALVNRIGSVIARNITWTNPLAEFKRGMMGFGDTIEEIQLGMLKAHSYEANIESTGKELFGTEPIPAQSSFHHTDRRDVYRFTVNEAQLQRAFLEQNGLSSFVSQMMAAPLTSDSWDEFLATCRLISQYDAYTDGFYHVKVSDPNASGADPAVVSKDILRRIRALNGILKFPSTKYNAAHMPTFANPDELILFTTPEIHATIDVDALAAAFNIDRMNVANRVIDIPAEHFGVEDAVGLLTTRDFFVLADTKIENASMWNPDKLSMKYFFHHWEIISASRFTPAVMFSTTRDDETVYVLPVPVSITLGDLTDEDGNVITTVPLGQYSRLSTVLVTNPANMPGIGRQWSVSGQSAKSKTTIDNDGVLFVDPKDTATSLTVTATVVWIDPATGSATPAITTSKSYTVAVAASDDGE